MTMLTHRNVMRGTTDLTHNYSLGMIKNVFEYVETLKEYYDFEAEDLNTQDVYQLSVSVTMAGSNKPRVIKVTSMDNRLEKFTDFVSEDYVRGNVAYTISAYDILNLDNVQDGNGYLLGVVNLGKFSDLANDKSKRAVLQLMPVYHSFLPMKVMLEDFEAKELLAAQKDYQNQKYNTDTPTKESVVKNKTVAASKGDNNKKEENDNMFNTNNMFKNDTMFDKMGTKIHGAVGISMLDGSIAFKLKDAWISRNQLGQLTDVTGTVQELDFSPSIVMPTTTQGIVAGDVLLTDDKLVMVTNVDYQQGSIEVQSGSGKVEKIMPVVNQMMGGAMVMKVFNPMTMQMQNSGMNPMMMAMAMGGDKDGSSNNMLQTMLMMSMMQGGNMGMGMMNPMQQPYMNQQMPMQPQYTQQPMNNQYMQQQPMQQQAQQTQQPQQQSVQVQPQVNQEYSSPVPVMPVSVAQPIQPQPQTQQNNTQQGEGQ